MKRVALTSTPDSVYDFFLPIAERMWRRIGYEPEIFVVGSLEEWSLGHRRAAIEEILAPARFLGHIPGVPDPNVSMSIRQHVSALPDIAGGDLVLVGDVDLLPLRKSFYHQHDPKEIDILIYFSNTNDGYYPAYGPSMTASVWREVMGIVIGDPVASMLRTFESGEIRRLIEERKLDPTKNELWVFDEKDASSRILKSRFLKGVVEVPVEKGSRLCRHSWPSTSVNVDHYIDCHCPRPGWSDGNAEKIRSVIAQAIPEDVRWFDGYVERYRRTRPVIDNPFA